MVPLKRWNKVGKILGKSTKMSQEEATPVGREPTMEEHKLWSLQIWPNLSTAAR